MEGLSPIISPDTSRFVAPETAVWQEIASDPAAIIILSALRMKNEHNIAELEKYIPSVLIPLYDKMLLILVSEGIIEVTDSKIRLLKHKNHSFWIQDYRSLFSAMPTINLAATKKALSNLNTGIRGNYCRGLFYPVEIQEEVHSILREAQLKLEKALGRNIDSINSKVGYVAMVSTLLSPEDIL